MPIHYSLVGCTPGPAGQGEYGVRNVKRRMTVLAIPNNARQPQHYFSDCTPRALRVAGRWLTELDPPPFRGGGGSWRLGYGQVPLITLMTDGASVRGYAHGAAPLMNPGLPSTDRRQILVALRNHKDGSLLVFSLIEGIKRVMNEKGLGDFEAAGQVALSAEGFSRRCYTGIFVDKAAPPLARMVSHYFAECNELKLCRLVAPIDGILGPDAIRDMVLDVWIHESQMPQARRLLLQIQGLLNSVASTRPITAAP